VPSIARKAATTGVKTGVMTIAFVSVLAIAPAAFATTPTDPAAATAEAEAREWVGRYCTPTGCAGAAASPIAQAASFGAASLTIAFLARRRRA
jgi:hypothetical protein